MACTPFLLTACNSSDAAAPLSPVPTVPAETPATPVAAPALLQVDRIIAPDTVRPGDVLALEGSGFATGPLDNTVTVGGVAAMVMVASPTRIEVRLPESGSFPCLASGAHTVRLTSRGRTAEQPVQLAVARRVALARGQSLNLLGTAATRCAEFVAPSGEYARYNIAVLNISQNATSTTGFQLRAASTGAVAPRAAGSVQVPSFSAPALDAATRETLQSLAAEAGVHGAHLTRERDRVAQRGSALADWNVERARVSRSGSAAAVVSAPLVVGQLVQRRAMYSSCSTGALITARVVYAGTRALVLEDMRSPSAGTMDAEYRALGEEFDAVQYPLLVAQVGDPLALDAAMNGDGRVSMLFTPYVNDSAPGTSGYVTSCNLYPRSQYSSSNEDEMFYARVPHATESASSWRRSMRSTVMHEAKHLAAFAERMSRGTGLEEPWLEEATARIAEELYARTFSRGATAWKANLGWSESVQCEVYQCDDRPLMMWKHFPVLHDYFMGADTLSPLGKASAGDVTYYASGWSLVRWAVDHFASDEGSFLRALVRGEQGTGMAALVAGTGRPADELLADWSLANVVDDRAGFTPERATLSFPSWNVPQMMAGLASMNGARYSAHPLRVTEITGDLQVAVPQLRGFSASYLETVVLSGSSQMLELRGAQGGALPASIRLAVVRVE